MWGHLNRIKYFNKNVDPTTSTNIVVGQNWFAFNRNFIRFIRKSNWSILSAIQLNAVTFLVDAIHAVVL